MAVLPAAQLLSGGFDIEANDLDKEAALQWAAKNGYQEVVQLLIDKKAEITAEDKDGWTALHYAARYGREEVVRLLVNKEADIKAKSKTKQTALVIAAEYGHKAVVQLLLNKGADIAALDKEEWTALHFAARYGHEPVVRLLSDNKADTMAKSKAGKTALVIAAQYGQEAVVKLLLSIGADIAVGDKHQWTALHFAARYGQEGVARLLLDNKADIMAKSKAGKTALALAAQYEHRAVVQLLLSKRADIKAEDEDKDDDEDTDEYEDKDEDEDAWYSAMSPSLNSPQSGKPQASVQNIKPLHKIKISPPKSVQGPPLLNMDVDLQFDSDGSLHYCDRCTTMMTTTGLKEAQSAKGYKHSNGISECEKRARGGPSIPGCSFCKMILDEMRYPRSSSGPLNFFSKLNGTKVCRGEPDSDLAYFDSLSVGPLAGFSSGLTLSFIAFTSDDDPAAAIVDRRPIIMDLVGDSVTSAAKSFIRNCQENHPNCPRERTPLLPSRVIDVGTDINSPSVKVHVSTPDQHGEYVCLSYCWGGSQAVTATRKTIQAIQNSIPLNSLGQTIQDAIETTRSLGFRYLWVDALCIIQDDDQDKIVEINKMASIYKNAVVTIAAAVSASSYEGFLRRDRTLRRKRCDFRFAMPDGAIGNIALAPERRYVPTHPIDRRAWTFQEFILSSRILMYSDFELLWDCETQQHQPLRKSVMSYSFSQSPRWFPQMLKRIIREGSSGTHPQWADIVSNYATRAMTDPEDRLNALAGVAHEFAQLLEDDYIFGMWRKKIIHHLGWQSLDPNSRRSPRAPSWSWACLDGGVDFFHYSTVAKLSAKTPDEDPRKLVLVCKVIPAHEVRGSQYNKVFNDLSIEEADDTRKFYMLLGENPPSEAVALVLMEVDQDLYKRIGLLNYADLKSWAKCKKREITLI